jgi:hypothetical protein
VLSGVVREVAPAEHPLAGGRVDIVEGPNTGKSVLINDSGAYQFTGLSSGQTSVTATLDGYIVWKSSFDLSADRQEDLWLTPNPPKNSDGATATARCKDGTWSWSQDQTAACAANGGIAYFVCPGPFCVNVIVREWKIVNQNEFRNKRPNRRLRCSDARTTAHPCRRRDITCAVSESVAH